MELTNSEKQHIQTKEAPRVENTKMQRGDGKKEKQLATTLLQKAKTSDIRTAMTSLAEGKPLTQEEKKPEVKTGENIGMTIEQKKQPLSPEQTLFTKKDEIHPLAEKEAQQKEQTEKTSEQRLHEKKEKLDLTKEQESTLTFLENHPDALDAYGKVLASSPEQMQKMMDVLAKAFGEDEVIEEGESLSLFGLLLQLLRAMLEEALEEETAVTEEEKPPQKYHTLV